MDIAANVILGILVCLLLMAAWTDAKFRRIPNWLVLLGMVIAILANGLLPKGLGFGHVFVPGALGWLAALQGFALGLAVLLPLYLLRAMGAGDVKLMGMVGMFLGPIHIQGALLFTFLAGGLLSVMLAMRLGMFRRLVENIKLILLDGVVKVSTGQVPAMEELPASAGKLPYGVAIAIGTFSWLAWQRIGY